MIESLAMVACILRHCHGDEEEHHACDVSAHGAAGRPHVGATLDIIDATRCESRSLHCGHLGLGTCARTIHGNAISGVFFTTLRVGTRRRSTRWRATLRLIASRTSVTGASSDFATSTVFVCCNPRIVSCARDTIALVRGTARSSRAHSFVYATRTAGCCGVIRVVGAHGACAVCTNVC